MPTSSVRYAVLAPSGAGNGEDHLLQTRPQPLRCRGCRRALALGATSACATGLAALSASRFWEWRGSDPPRLRAFSEGPYFREYDPNMPGGMPMPGKSSQYDGVEDKRDFWIDQNADMTHIFVVGDWGALMPNHQTAACNGWDCNAQGMVANAMKNRAGWAHPQYILNVGDAFYWGGIDVSCNAPPSAAWGGTTRGAFSSVWQGMYNELTGVPWIGTLGNHDYGGRKMDEGWPQLIGYSFVNHNWILPARYYSRKVQHKGYVAEYFVIDSNVFDALEPWEEAKHNMCSQQFNPPGAQCTGNDGPSNIWNCKGWFWGSYQWQKKWMEQKVRESTSRWKIAVTHFPCGYDGSWYKGLYDNYGLDLLVTGHRHQQELWYQGSPSSYIREFMNKNDIGYLPCIVSGGGGGIVGEHFSNADYGRDLQVYGFFDLTMAKDWMNVELVGTDMLVKGNVSISPHEIRPAPTTTSTVTRTTTMTTSTTTPENGTEDNDTDGGDDKKEEDEEDERRHRHEGHDARAKSGRGKEHVSKGQREHDQKKQRDQNRKRADEDGDRRRSREDRNVHEKPETLKGKGEEEHDRKSADHKAHEKAETAKGKGSEEHVRKSADHKAHEKAETVQGKGTEQHGQKDMDSKAHDAGEKLEKGQEKRHQASDHNDELSKEEPLQVPRGEVLVEFKK